MIQQRTLACGRAYDDVLADVADDDLDQAHLAGCASCRAAVDDARSVWDEVDRLAGERVTAPPGLTRAVLARVLAARASGALLLPGGGLGLTSVAGRVLARSARVSAATVPGVLGAVARDLRDGSGAAVEIAVTAAYGLDLRALAARLRRVVRADLAASLGTGVRIDVVVDDVHGS